MDNQTKKCPYCAEEIKMEATKCKYCQSNLVQEHGNIELKESDQKWLNKFSIGGLMLGFIYLISVRAYSKLWLILLLFIPIPILNIAIAIIVAIIIGLKGRRWAWESRKWSNIEELKIRQGFMDKLGIVFVVLIIIAILWLISSLEY